MKRFCLLFFSTFVEASPTTLAHCLGKKWQIVGCQSQSKTSVKIFRIPLSLNSLLSDLSYIALQWFVFLLVAKLNLKIHFIYSRKDEFRPIWSSERWNFYGTMWRNSNAWFLLQKEEKHNHIDIDSHYHINGCLYPSALNT